MSYQNYGFLVADFYELKIKEGRLSSRNDFPRISVLYIGDLSTDLGPISLSFVCLKSSSVLFRNNVRLKYKA